MKFASLLKESNMLLIQLCLVTGIIQANLYYKIPLWKEVRIPVEKINKKSWKKESYQKKGKKFKEIK
jgi:hypothetical protein